MKQYTSLEDMMTDALTVESVKKTRDHMSTRKEVHYPANQKTPSGSLANGARIRPAREIDTRGKTEVYARRSVSKV